MNDKLISRSSITIDAPATKVWLALTQPEWIRQYFFGTEAVSEWTVGSPIMFKGEWKGRPYEDKGIIIDSEPPTLFRYKYWSSMSGMEDKAENYVTIAYELSERQGQTTLDITQDNIPDEKMKEHARENWQTVLTGLKKLLENEQVKA